MERPVRHTLSALAALALVGCSQNAGPSANAGPSLAAEEWIARAAAIVRVSDNAEQTWDCEFLTALTFPDGWDGKLGSLSPEGEAAIEQLKLATANVGGNFVLVTPGPAPGAEAYLCTE